MPEKHGMTDSAKLSAKHTATVPATMRLFLHGGIITARNIP